MDDFKDFLITENKTKLYKDYRVVPHKIASDSVVEPDGSTTIIRDPKSRYTRLLSRTPVHPGEDYERLHQLVDHAFEKRIQINWTRGNKVTMTGPVRDAARMAINGGSYRDIADAFSHDSPANMVTMARKFIHAAQGDSPDKINLDGFTPSNRTTSEIADLPGGAPIQSHLKSNVPPEYWHGEHRKTGPEIHDEFIKPHTKRSWADLDDTTKHLMKHKIANVRSELRPKVA